MDLERGEMFGQGIEGKIRKAAQEPPVFDAAQKKQFLHNTQRDLEEGGVHVIPWF
jgi:hypothetical protein